MEKQDYVKMFNLFKGDNPYRPQMNQPFKKDGYYVATDAHGLIFMPESACELPFDAQDKPIWLPVVPKETCNIDIDLSLIKFSEQKSVKCKKCDGTGIRVCGECGNETDCHECEGGYTEPQVAYLLYGQWFTYRILKKLIESCKIMQIDKIKKLAGQPETAGLFDCGEVKIILMPNIIDVWKGEKITLHE